MQRKILGLATAAALLLVACGGDDDKSSATTSAGSTPVTEAIPAPDTTGGPESGATLTVPTDDDPRDGHLAPLLGLALSRAWQQRELADLLDEEARVRVRDRTRLQIERVAGAITTGDFMATHWLVSFALKADLAA